GLKPKLAQEHGAIGCLIYSDPYDDGYAHGDTYPRGGWRPPEGVQRGSVLDMATYPGDPLTPGVGATRDAKRLAISQARTILKIPVMPISYADAQPLLAAIAGPVAPGEWRGSLPITYHLGAGPARAHLAIASDWSQKPLYDVIARIPGSETPEEWVVRGNHRDGWVFGAWDPLSGQIAMLAEAKAIGALLKSGWRPRRTLVYASWDGEEPGLLGSTEWAEQHAAELQRKAVLYLNSDSNTRGFLKPDGSHSLQHIVNDVARSVKDPETGVSSQRRLRARQLVQGYEKDPTEVRDVSEEKARVARVASKGGDLAIARSARVRTTPRFCSTSASPHSASSMAARRTRRASTIPTTTRSITTCASAIRPSGTASPRPRRSGTSCCGWPMRRCCRCSSAVLRAPC